MRACARRVTRQVGKCARSIRSPFLDRWAAHKMRGSRANSWKRTPEQIMSEEKLSLHIDTDWKKQAQEEKRRLGEQEHKRDEEGQRAASAAPPVAPLPLGVGGFGPAAGLGVEESAPDSTARPARGEARAG